MQEKLYFREDLLIPLQPQLSDEVLDNWPLYLEYQRLNDVWDKLEARWILDEETQALLELIWEKQTEILNQIAIN